MGYTGRQPGRAISVQRLSDPFVLSLQGDANGHVTIDASQDVTINTAVQDDSHNHVIGNVDGLQSTLDLKAPLASPNFTGTVSGITKTMVGLGSVDNTADIDKNVLYATNAGTLDGQHASAFQPTLVSGTNIKTVGGTSLLGTGDVAVSSFPVGTVMLFVQSTAPTGWTKSITHDNKALRVVSGTAGSGGTVNFTTAFASHTVSGTVDGTTLTSTQIPSHAHNAQIGGWGNVQAYPAVGIMGSSSGALNYQAFIQATGGGGSHTHTFTGNAINFAVAYVDVIICQKD